MTKKEMMQKAHKMAKGIKAEYPSVDYKFQLGLCLKYLYKEEKMIKYTTENGAKVEIKLEGKLVTDLIVNDTVVIEDNTREHIVFVSALSKCIVLNDSLAYRKLGSSSVIRIAANEEVMQITRAAAKKAREDMEKRTKKFVQNTKISMETYNYTIEKHLNDRNAI